MTRKLTYASFHARLLAEIVRRFEVLAQLARDLEGDALERRAFDADAPILPVHLTVLEARGGRRRPHLGFDSGFEIELDRGEGLHDGCFGGLAFSSDVSSPASLFLVFFFGFFGVTSAGSWPASEARGLRIVTGCTGDCQD